MYHPWFQKIVLFFFYALLVIGLVLPSTGSHGVLHPKTFGFLFLLSSLPFYFLLKGNLLWSQLQTVLLSLCFLLFLFFSVTLRLGLDSDHLVYALDQCKLFIITFGVVVSAFLLYQEKTVRFSTFLQTLVYANCFYSLGKLVLTALFLLKMITMKQFIDMTGIRVMEMKMFGDLSRFQTSLDIITPFLLFFLLERKLYQTWFPKGFVPFYLCISFFSCVLSFSRVFLFFFFLAILFHLAASSLDRFLRGLLLLSLLLVGMGVYLGQEKVEQMVYTRLFSKENNLSDEIRREQQEALLDEFTEHTFVGKGMGSFAKEVQRDDKLPYSYEVQWLSFLLQFGTLGLVFFVFLLFLLVYPLFFLPLHAHQVALLTFFSGFVFSGFTNPFVISLTSGIIYALFGLGSRDYAHTRHRA